MNRSYRSGRASQSGATVIEFAFVFPLLFLITYSSLVYGFVFYINQTLNFVAQESARFAIASTPAGGGSGGSASFCPALTMAANSQFAAFQASPGLGPALAIATQTPLCPAPSPSASGGSSFQVTVTVDTATLISMGFAQITLPIIGTFPPLPTSLTGNAVVAIN